MLRYHQFVRLKASSYFLAGGDSEDLIQEGMLGLYKAVRDYRDDRLASFRSFAELCITRQIITAIKTATRQKHVPLNGYLSFSQHAERRRRRRRLHRWPTCCPGPRYARSRQPGDLGRRGREPHDVPHAPALDARGPGAAPVPAGALSYERIAGAARLRLQDRRQRAAAHQAQGRSAPRKPQGPAQLAARAVARSRSKRTGRSRRRRAARGVRRGRRLRTIIRLTSCPC